MDTQKNIPWQQEVRRRTLKLLLHPAMRTLTETCSTVSGIVGDLHQLRSPWALALGSGALLDKLAERASSSGDDPATAYLVDVLHLRCADYLQIDFLVSAKQLLKLEGLVEIIRDRYSIIYQYVVHDVTLWFSVPRPGSEERHHYRGRVHGSGFKAMSITTFVDVNTPLPRQRAAAKEVVKRCVLRSLRSSKSNVIEVGFDAVDGGVRFTAVTTPLEHTNLDDVLELACDITHKRRQGRSPSYIFDGPAGTGKTTFAMAVGQLMGGLTIVVGASFLPATGKSAAFEVLIETLCPDVVIVDDFDKCQPEVRQAFYTSLPVLKALHPNIAFILTTNDAATLGAPLLRPGRNGVLRRFVAPTREQKIALLLDVGVDDVTAHRVGDKLPEGMTHDWVVYLGNELLQSPHRAETLTQAWLSNWDIASRVSRAAVENDDDDDDEMAA